MPCKIFFEHFIRNIRRNIIRYAILLISMRENFKEPLLGNVIEILIKDKYKIYIRTYIVVCVKLDSRNSDSSHLTHCSRYLYRHLTESLGRKSLANHPRRFMVYAGEDGERTIVRRASIDGDLFLCSETVHRARL